MYSTYKERINDLGSIVATTSHCKSSVQISILQPTDSRLKNKNWHELQPQHQECLLMYDTCTIRAPGVRRIAFAWIRCVNPRLIKTCLKRARPVSERPCARLLCAMCCQFVRCYSAFARLHLRLRTWASASYILRPRGTSLSSMITMGLWWVARFLFARWIA